MPEGAPWVAEFLREVTTFPAAAHDDYEDALVYAVVFLRTSGAALSESDRQFMGAASQQLHSQAERNRNLILARVRGLSGRRTRFTVPANDSPNGKIT